MFASRIIRILLALVGVVLIVLSVVIAANSKSIFDFLLQKTMSISPHSPIYEPWVQPSIKVRIRYYFFNVTNAKEAQNGETPILKEVGPYTYLKYTRKENIKFNDDGTTVSFDIIPTFYFCREESVGEESDVITTLNPMIVVLANKLMETPGLLHGAAQLLFWNFDFNNLFMDRSVEELLYSGYSDILIKLIGTVVPSPNFEGGKFGYTKGQNGTKDSHLKVYTGSGGMENYANIIEYNGEKDLDYWNNPYCNMINGTDGQQFPPAVTKQTKLTAFLHQFCRSVDLEFKKESSQFGLRTYRFGISDDLFKVKPNNTCFCVDEYTCRDGVYNLSPCSHGAPVLASGPHFYYGQQSDVDNFIGLSPNKDKHEIYLELEPTTGIVTKGFKRAQMNLPLRKTDALPALQHVNDIVFPVLWLEETAELPEYMINMIMFGTKYFLKVCYFICACILFGGGLLIYKSTNVRRNIPKDKLGQYMLQTNVDSKEKLSENSSWLSNMSADASQSKILL